ncbi:MAG: ubiquinone/menaquinone biosynthesis protein [Rhodobacteraceae bacterium]|nr:ubiquinone/menaquinone biosynthesis protein [Paracoccaceae bacterium]
MIDCGDNEGQRKFWNDKPGQSWVKYDDVMNLRLENITDLLFGAVDGTSASSGLDIGCGTGSTTLKLLELLGEDSKVKGIDISEPMLSKAQEKIHDTTSISFIKADAQTFQFPLGYFETVISRFGVMFFDDPVKAFRNIRSAMSPSADLTFVCWAPFEKNEFFSLPLEVVTSFVGSVKDIEPHAPGPLAFSDIHYVKQVLNSADFSDIDIKELETSIVTNDPPEEDAEILMNIGFGARALREAELDKSLRNRIYENFVKNSQDRYSDGLIRYSATINLVKARA